MTQSSSKFFFFFCLLTIAFCLHLQGAEERIHWCTDYDRAADQCQESGKPLLVFFTGSDWCGWCNKLEDEALNTSAFFQDAGDKFVFLKLDFPLYSNLDSATTAKNKELQDKFEVRSFPTVVILDEKLQPVGMTGYRPGGGREYAAHLLKMFQDYTAYRNQMSNLNPNKFSGEDLKHLYEKAREFGNATDAHQIVRVGMNSDQERYFLTERYRCLAEKGQINDQEALKVKQQLLATDPHNAQKTHYELALIDFEANCEQMEKEEFSPDLTVEPLIGYIKRFGIKDKDNLWRLQMIVSQVYLDNNELRKALKYAKASHRSAPSSIQPEIAMAIRSIQSQMHQTP